MRRFLLVLLALAAVVTIGTAVVRDWRTPDLERAGYDQSPSGPIGPADRDMMYKVKQAGLWEMPVGAEANERAVTPRLREVGAKISAEHGKLDALVENAAEQLGVELPTEPTDEQKAWMADISAQQGAAYDKRAVFLLRQAHGKVLPVLAQVRAGTRNDVVRALAEDSMAFVLRHINYLESTGLVEYEQLPEAPGPTPGATPVTGSYFDQYDWRTIVIAIILIGIILALGFLVARTLIGKRKQSAATRPHSRRARRSTGRHAK